MIPNWALVKDVKWCIMETMTIMNNENKETSEPTGGMFFYIVCPCNCGRAVPLVCTPCSGDISELANQVWQRTISEKGLEGAIEFIHEMIDVG